MDDELRELINQAYDSILQTANKALRNCRMFSIKILKQEDPSYEVVALHLEEVSKLIEAVHNAHPEDIEGFRLAVKAQEYAQDISNIAGAIRLENEALLQEYIELLDRRPFI